MVAAILDLKGPWSNGIKNLFHQACLAFYFPDKITFSFSFPGCVRLEVYFFKSFI